MSDDEKPFCGAKLTYTFEDGRLRLANTLDEIKNDEAFAAVAAFISYFITVGFPREYHDSVMCDLLEAVREENASFLEYFDAQEAESARRDEVVRNAKMLAEGNA